MATECRHTEGPQHDCAYVDARNALIPRAEQRAAMASDALRRELGWYNPAAVLTRAFIMAMDDLALQTGIVKQVVPASMKPERKRAS